MIVLLHFMIVLVEELEPEHKYLTILLIIYYYLKFPKINKTCKINDKLRPIALNLSPK